MTDTKLTEAQLRGIAYYKYLALPADERKALRKANKAPRHPDPRVDQALLDQGLIKVSHYHYGPHYKLTAAGEAVKS